VFELQVEDGSLMEILGALMEQPRLPTNLAQIANVNPGRLDGYLSPLLTASLIKKDKIEGHEVVTITMEGRNAWEQLYKIERTLDPARAASGGGVPS
jgi:predicted transcriptional regulator